MSGRVMTGILHHVDHGIVSYADLRKRLHVLAPSLTASLRLLARRGEVQLLDRRKLPIDVTGPRRHTRWICRP